MKTIWILAALAISAPASDAFAWDGTDNETGTNIEIEKGNLVREGRDIEIFDHEDGSYRDVEVQSIRRSGSSVELEVYDNGTGQFRTFEMEDD